MITIGSALLGYDCWEKGHSLQDLGIEGMTKGTFEGISGNRLLIFYRKE